MKVEESKAEPFSVSSRSQLYFPKGEFKNGFIFAFYSENPCGCMHNGDIGWIVYNPATKEIVDEIDTKMYHQSVGNDYKGWLAFCKERFGKLQYYVRYDGTHFWRAHE